MEASYWSRILNGRARRRRVLAATGGSAAAALLLAACGGGDDGGGDSEGLVTETEDTSKEARRGGTLKDRTNSDISTMDVQQPIAPLNYPAKHVYSTLVRLKTPYLKAEPTLEMSPDFAESWETSPDGLTITMKLRQNAKWHNRPPVNGRVADASDVVFSWNKYAASAPLRGLAANSANPQAPVLSVEATDPRTVSIKLKEPLVYALELFASFGSFTGNMIVIPKETDAGFDIRRDMIGTGPYMLSEYQPSIRFVLKRNPDYWDQNANFIEQIEYPIIIEYAQFLSQLKAGNIHHTSDQLRGEDLLVLKRDDPRLLMYALDLQTASSVMTFGWLPAGNSEKSPFADERVRQAWSMSLDRAAWVDAMFNVPELETGGIPVQSRWNSALPADFGEDAGWLDPEGKDFGANAKYYARNIEEAKKLLAAAGFANGLDVKSNRITTGIIADLARHSEAVEGMAADAGFRVRVNDIDYATQYIPQVRDAQGQYEGVGFHTVTGTTPWRMSPVSALAAEYWSKAGATFKGFSTSGRNDLSGDPAVDSLVEKARLEKDAKSRKTLVEDIQRHLAKSAYGLINPGTANKFSVAWPALRNFQVYRHIGQSAWKDYSVWIDETKPPFTNA